MRKENDRSYIVEANGREYRRERFHIRKSGELSRPKASVPEHPVAVTINPDVPVPIPEEYIQRAASTNNKEHPNQPWTNSESRTEHQQRQQP